MAAHPVPRSPRSSRRFPLVLVCLVFVGCGEDRPGAAASATVDTIAGVEELTYAKTTAPRLDWSVDTVLVLGDAMAEPEYHFGMPDDAQLAGDDRGHIYVADEEGSRVLQYGPAGRHVATYGREGEGPGELKMPLGVVVGPGDTVWVNDPVNRRVTGYPQGVGDPRVVSYPRRDIFPGTQMARQDDGTVRRVVRRDPPARAATEADRQRVRDRILNEEPGFSVSMNGQGPDERTRRRMAEARIDALRFEDRIPRIVALNVDPRGRSGSACRRTSRTPCSASMSTRPTGR